MEEKIFKPENRIVIKACNYYMDVEIQDRDYLDICRIALNSIEKKLFGEKQIKVYGGDRYV